MRVLVADADEDHRQGLLAVLGTEPGLELRPPAATCAEVSATPGVDVVLLVGCLDAADVPSALSLCPDGAARVAMVAEDADTTDLLHAGAHGCLVVSSTPLQIVAALQAAAAGERADPWGGPVTGPLVQRVRNEVSELTDREVDVLRLVAAGLGNRQIAERLYLSRSSVKSHLAHTYGRLGVNHRGAAAAEARRRGLI